MWAISKLGCQECDLAGAIAILGCQEHESEQDRYASFMGNGF